MIDMYTIGMTIKLNNLAMPELLRMAQEFKKLDTLTADFNKNMKAVGGNVAGIRALKVEIGALDSKLAGANHQAMLLDRHLRNLKAAGVLMGTGSGGPGVFPPIYPPSYPGGRGPGGGRGPIPGGGAGGGGGHGRGGFHGGNLHMGPGGVGIGGVGYGLGANALVPLAVGLGTLYIGHGMYEEAKKLEKAQADFGNLNLSREENKEALQKANLIANSVRGTVITENLALIQDLHTATGDLHHALELSKPYAIYANAAKVQNGGRPVDNLVMNSIKALEHRGDAVMQNPAQLAREMSMQSQVHFFTKGVVSPSDYFAMSRTGKLAYQLASPEYLYGPAAALISANTGATAGTMEMTALSSLVGGHMDKKAKGFLAELGLWQEKVDPQVAAYRKQFEKDADYQKIVAANGGNLIQTGGLSAENTKLFIADRNKFVLDVLMPAIKKRYGLDMSNEDIARLLSANFNRNTSADLGFYVTNQLKVAKDTAGIQKDKDFMAANSSYMETATGAEENFVSAWKNFKTEFGKNVLPVVTGMLNDGADILRKIGQAKEYYFPSKDDKDGGWLSWLPKSRALKPAWEVQQDKQAAADAAATAPKPRMSSLETVADASYTGPGQQAGNVYLDGQKVGTVISPTLAKMLNRPTGGSAFDMKQAMPPPGYNYAK